jgi:malate dehydrogenase (oxaloacetate-decarboxylating)(NADP+)
MKKIDPLKEHKKKNGKLEVRSTVSIQNMRDLAVWYTPGVGDVATYLGKHPEKARDYTIKRNTVAIVSDGSSVLGLGNIGPYGALPVMEGKAAIFKEFADIDAFPIVLDTQDPGEIVQAVAHIAPAFGGINLEDIAAPHCFDVETRLKAMLDIPVFHDDQHGTAIICAAAFLNAIEVTNRDICRTKIVFSGGGAAAIACAHLFLKIGVKRHNIIMCDSKGVIHRGRRDGMNQYKEFFALDTDKRSLEEALVGADAFIGVSVADALKPEMILPMAPKPIIFAMANPDPEIRPEIALKVRPDTIMATGRSDYPNQVNNVLGFPFIFRKTLDVHARCINEEMKLAAMEALAKLAKEPVPDAVSKAYGGNKFSFGPGYLIPKPMDPRVLSWVAPAVAQAAMQTGVARKPIRDMDAYRRHLVALSKKIKGDSEVVRWDESFTSEDESELAVKASPEVTL